MFNHILVPLDQRSGAVETMSSIRQWLGGTGATVCLLAVRRPVREIERRGDRIVHLDELMREEYAQCHDYLVRLGSHLAYNGIVVQREVRFGELLTETLAVARQHSVQAIVLTGQEQPRRSLFRANWVHQLLASAEVPVLVMPQSVPASPRTGLRYRSVPV
ncbi:MAG TPA: universal stress protein [Chloroflexota bacterium]|nr:universal stress protein [Chloroflexota bacterium]